MKVLITGFDPFGGESINPAFEAVRRMKDNIEGCEVVKCEVPTVFEKSIAHLERAIERENPDIVICVGQAGGRFNICLEAVAINLNEARIPDNEGNQPSGEKVRVQGKNAYFSTLPNKAILKACIENKVPAQVSYTAGTYVCNHIFYGLMYLIESKYPKVRGGFIHVPFLPEQVIGKKNMPFMSLNQMTQALEIAVAESVKNESDISMRTGETH